MTAKSENRDHHAVAVVGLGYIGLPTAVAFATSGLDVVGIDINIGAVEAINRGEAPFVESNLEVALSGAVSMGRLTATTEYRSADAFIIAVPTPFGEGHRPDLSYVRAAVRSMAEVLKPGDLVVLESTSPPGTTLAMSEWIAAARPDLRLPHAWGEDADIAVAHCPERVLPGRIMIELVTNDRVIGGITPSCARRAAELYRSFCEGECIVTDATTAELVKLAENSYRDVNIAFANELSMIARKLDVDVHEVIGLANRHPRVDILRPGPGVGGHCIAVDPWFIVDAAPDDSRLIRTAREVNDSKPSYVVQEVERIARRLQTPTIACLGLTFKANVDDLRESPSIEIVRDLASRKLGDVVVAEPCLTSLPPILDEDEIRLLPFHEAIASADVVVLLVAHDAFGHVVPEGMSEKILIDTCGGWRTRS